MSARPVKYDIKVEKDRDAITATYDLSLPTDDTSLISSFELYVEGINVIGKIEPGNKTLKGAKTYRLTSADKDALVQFSITTNHGWSDSNKGTLRGDRRYDDVHFGRR